MNASGVKKKKAPTKGGKKSTKKKAPPKAAQFAFGSPANPFKAAKKGGKPTTFANAMESMNNLISDLEIVDTIDAADLLNDPAKKESLLNCIQNNDYAKFEMLLGMFDNEGDEE